MSAAYSRLARPRVSAAAGLAVSAPASTAAVASPLIFTSPHRFHHSRSGVRHKWASPAACAIVSPSAAAVMISAARTGSSGPAAMTTSSRSPPGHSVTM